MTPQEFTEMMEIWALHGMEADNQPPDLWDAIYQMAHVANGRCKNPHADWARFADAHRDYWQNANKAPADQTKIADLKYPGLKGI